MYIHVHVAQNLIILELGTTIIYIVHVRTCACINTQGFQKSIQSLVTITDQCLYVHVYLASN